MSRPRIRLSGVFLAVLTLAAAALLSYGCTSSDESTSEPTSTSSEGTVSMEPGERAREGESTSGAESTSERTLRPRSTQEEEAARPENSRSEDKATKTLATEIRSTARNYPGTYGVMVWQPASGERGSVGADRSFEAASLAKLPVLLALYREAAAGRVELDEQIKIRPSDIVPGTGVLKDRPPGTTLTLRQTANHLISESDNTAWAMLERRLGEPRIEQELASIGADTTHYEYGHHTTTPRDVLRMLQHISDPDYTTPALSEEMLSHMTGTAFEEGLPKGLPQDARVAHKIGILGDSFHDAGVVYPAGGGEAERYYIVVLSDDTTQDSSTEAMREMSSTAYRSLVDP